MLCYITIINSNNSKNLFFKSQYKISNIGIMKNTASENIIQIKEHYRFVSNSLLGFGMTTVSECLCIAINFDEEYYSIQFINDLKQFFLEKIHQIIQFN